VFLYDAMLSGYAGLVRHCDFDQRQAGSGDRLLCGRCGYRG
jgi:hypothetical protein